MARILGAAGKSARQLSIKRQHARKLVQLIGMGAVVLVLVIDLWLMKALAKMGPTAAAVVSVAAFVVLVSAMKRIDREVTAAEGLLRKRARDADRGANAEDNIAARLAALPDAYVVFHNLARVCGDIDHIVVGPTGVFTLETKGHRGTVTSAGNQVLVNGRPPEKDFIAQAWRNAYWVRDLLKNVAGIEVEVKPILVFANAYVKVKQVKGVQITYGKALAAAMTGRPAIELPVERIIEILTQKMGS